MEVKNVYKLGWKFINDVCYSLMFFCLSYLRNFQSYAARKAINPTKKFLFEILASHNGIVGLHCMCATYGDRAHYWQLMHQGRAGAPIQCC